MKHGFHRGLRVGALGAGLVLFLGCSKAPAGGDAGAGVGGSLLGGGGTSGAGGVSGGLPSPPSGSGGSAGASGASGAASGAGGSAGSAGSLPPPPAGTGGAGAGAGSGGMAGSAAGAGAGAAGMLAPGDAYVREAAPTASSIRGPGEYTVSSYTEADGLTGGTAYGDAAIAGDGSELYYPEGATPPFAAMVIVPGFTAQRSDVAPWGSFLASHGIVSLVIDTNVVTDTPDIRSAALLDAVESLKKENMRTGAPIAGQIDTSRIGLMGWSMGGGGTWLSADAHPEIAVAVSLCGWIIGAVGGSTSVPSLQLAVQDDELAAGMSQPVYMAIPESTPKMLVEWAAGGHWTNNDPASQNHEVGAYGLPWIKVYLEHDERYRQFFAVMPMATSDFRTNQ